MPLADACVLGARMTMAVCSSKFSHFILLSTSYASVNCCHVCVDISWDLENETLDR